MNLPKKQIPSFQNLQSFIAAAKHNSFTQAALELHLTQSAVSRQIKELESQLGLSLFTRVRQRVVLTDTGTRFLEDAINILHTTENAMLKAITLGEKQSLNIAALPTFTNRWVIPKLQSFIRTNPDLALSFSTEIKPFDFNAQSADVAIHFGQPNWPNARCYLISKEQMVPVASKNYLALNPINQLEDLQQCHLLQLSSRLGSWKLWFEQNNLDISFNNHLSFDQFSMIIDALKADLGIALLPKYFIDQELQHGSVIALAQPIFTQDSYYLVIPDDKAENMQVKLFKDWILSYQEDDHGSGK